MFSEKILDIKEVAKYLKCSEAFIRKLTYSEKIPFFRIGRRILFKQSKLEEWISNNER